MAGVEVSQSLSRAAWGVGSSGGGGGGLRMILRSFSRFLASCISAAVICGDESCDSWVVQLSIDCVNAAMYECV